MKTKSLGDTIREAAHLHRNINKPGGLWMPEGTQTSRHWPLCLTCGREVDAANLEDVSNTGCEIRVKCHGSEDAIRVSWTCPASSNSNDPLEDRNVGWQIKRALADSSFFDPRHIIDFGIKKS